MANFKVKNGLSVGTRYLQTGGTETAGSEGYSLSAASYDSVSFSVASQDASPQDVHFKSDGTKMYIVGYASDAIFQYSLSTAWDVSTASYDSVSFSTTSQMTDPRGFTFSSDGTKMYVVGNTTDKVWQYTLSTAWDLSTTSYASKSFSVASEDGTPLGVAFNNNGTKMYISGSANDSFYQYTLSTAYDVSTASYDSVSFNVNSQETSPYTVVISSTGSKMFHIGSGSDKVHQYSLSTAFDLNTIAYDNVSFDVTSQEGIPLGLSFKPDGTKMYVIGAAQDTIYQYSTAAYTQTLDLSTGTTFSFTPSGATTVSFTNAPASGIAIGFSVEIVGDGSAITWPSSVKWPSGVAPVALASKELYTFVTTDGGTTYYGKKAAEGIA